MAVDIWRIIRLVRFRPWLFLAGWILGAIMVLIAPSFAAKQLQVYKSTAKILITPNASGNIDPGVKTWFADENTIRVLLSSQDLLEVVLDAIGSKINWVEFRERIQVSVLSQGGTVSLLEVSVVGGKSEEVRIMTQTLCEKFIQYVQQLSAAEHDKTVAYLERERRNIEQEIARSQKRLMKLGFFPAGTGQSNSIEDSWVELQTRRADLEKEFAMAQAEVEQLTIAESEGIETASLQAGSGDNLSSVVSKERLKLAELREVYTEHSVQVQQQIEKLKKVEALQQSEFSRSVNARVLAARRKSERIKSLLRQTEARLAALEKKRPGPEKQFEYASEDRQLQMWQETALSLTRQLYQARTLQQSSRREGAFTIVEKPLPGRLVAGDISSKSFLTQLAMAVPLGLVVGIGVVLASEYLSASMRLEPRIEEALGLPILGSVPNISEDIRSTWDNMKHNLQRPSGHSDD